MFSRDSLKSHGQGIFLLSLKYGRLTRKWTLADMRRLDCSIVKTSDQRLANMKGKGKVCHKERLDMRRCDSRPTRTALDGH